MKNLLFVMALAVSVCAIVVSTPVSGQTSSTDEAIEAAAKPIRLEGIVTSCKKYSFTVQQGGTEYTVKLADDAPVGLKMNKPWFDWENEQVVVDAVNFLAGSKAAKSNPPKRVALKFPAKKLFVISRLGDEVRMKETMSAEVKRLNFYLVTPNDPGQHFPTAEQPYLAGELLIKDKKANVRVNEQTLPVKLGFRYATMNGFSITQLEPNKTQVFLTGVWTDGEDEIVATRVLFQPVVTAQTMTSSPIDTPPPIAKQ